jgi:hypothetical protein
VEHILDVLLPLELVGTCGQLIVNVSKGTDQVNWRLAFSPVLRIGMVFISVVDPGHFDRNLDPRIRTTYIRILLFLVNG